MPATDTELTPQPAELVQVEPLRSLRRSISWTVVGNLVYAACQWGMLIVLARLGSPDALGQFTLGLAIGAPVLMLSNLQLRAVQATDSRRQHQFRDYFAVRLLGSSTAFLIVLAIVLLAGYSGATAAVILLVTAAKVSESLSDVFHGLQQQHERLDRIAVSMMMKGVASVLTLAILMALTGDLIVAVTGIVVVWTLLLLAYDVPQGMALLQRYASDGLWPRWRFSTLWAIAWVTLPLGVAKAMSSLTTNVPRYVLEREFSTRELGIFAALAYLMVAGGTIIVAAGQALTPRLARYYAEGNSRAFVSLLSRFVALCVCMGIAGLIATALLGEWLLRLLYGEEYAAHHDTLLLVMLAATLAYIASGFGHGVTATRRFAIQLPMTTIAVAATVIASVILIPKHGLNGAPLALLVGMSVQAALALGVVIQSVMRLKSRAGAT